MNNKDFIDEMISISSKNIVISGGFDLNIEEDKVWIPKESIYLHFHLGFAYDEDEILNMICEESHSIDKNNLKKGGWFEFKALLKWDYDDYQKWLYFDEIIIELVRTHEEIQREEKIFQILGDDAYDYF
jgi:hypothetical protein